VITFFDTEFLEDGSTIMPISIGMVAADGRELYLEFAFDEERVLKYPDPWVATNVLPHLRFAPSERLPAEDVRYHVEAFLRAGETLHEHRGDLRITTPEIWAYFASYDWIVLAQLWGRMVDLPTWMPYHPMDLQQWWVQMGRPKIKPPKPVNAHDALADARWNRDFHAALVAEASRQEYVAAAWVRAGNMRGGV
jgi:hypothetical protein